MNEIKVRQWLGLCLALFFGFYIYIVFNAELVNDDYMALYTSWLLSTGQVADVDFNVDSYTLLFDLMAPVYYLTGEHFEIVYVFRVTFLFLLMFMGWQISIILRNFFKTNVVLVTLILLFSSYAITLRGLDLRPDIFILILWLQTLIVLYFHSTSVAQKLFWASLLFGLAMLFKFKAILICVVVGLYLIGQLVQKRSMKALLIEVGMFLSGVVICLVLFVIITGFDSFELFLRTTRDLVLYTSSHVVDSNTLKSRVLVHYFFRDPFYLMLALIGVVVAIRQTSSLSSIQKQCAVMIAVLATLSVIANPHYHSYNLVTLYPLLALFVGFTIQHIDRYTPEWSKGKIAFYSMIVVTLLTRNLQHSVQTNNQHQRALQTFIDRHVKANEAIFSFEGIGMFRPSTYHWRTSAIKLSNYYNGYYNVWNEISSTMPVLIIESYRVPGWLLGEDSKKLYQHYVSIAPSILTIGMKTNKEAKGRLLKSGMYVIRRQSNTRCWVDGKELVHGDKLLLDAGPYTLMADGGMCTLHWYFPPEEIFALKQSNANKLPYLFSP